MAYPGAPANGGAFGPAQVPLCYYHDYFTLPNNDPFNNSYAEVLEPYRVPLVNNNVLLPVQVWDLAINCHPQGMPTTFTNCPSYKWQKCKFGICQEGNFLFHAK
jgi:hypothetical protein